MDKHRLMLPAITLAQFRQPLFENVRSASGTYPGDWIQIVDGSEVYRVVEYELVDRATGPRISSPVPTTLIFGNPQLDPVELEVDRTKGAVTAADLRETADRVQAVIDSFADVFEHNLS